MLEAICMTIVAAYVANAARLGQGREVAVWMPLIALAAWLGEDTAIRWYAYYGYAPVWRVVADHVPVAVALIWPVVVLSARDVARHLLPGREAAWPWLATAIVAVDAALIEPVAVKAGLWAWASPGMFGVPPIGLVGWAAFALGAQLAIAHLRGPARLGVLAIAPLTGHLAIMATWWAGYRHLDGFAWPDAAVAAVGGGALALLGGLALARRAHGTLPLPAIWPRMLAAAFFFGLLFTSGARNDALTAYALAFALPYCAALAPWSSAGRSSGSPAATQAP